MKVSINELRNLIRQIIQESYYSPDERDVYGSDYNDEADWNRADDEIHSRKNGDYDDFDDDIDFVPTSKEYQLQSSLKMRQAFNTLSKSLAQQGRQKIHIYFSSYDEISVFENASGWSVPGESTLLGVITSANVSEDGSVSPEVLEMLGL